MGFGELRNFTSPPPPPHTDKIDAPTKSTSPLICGPEWTYSVIKQFTVDTYENFSVARRNYDRPLGRIKRKIIFFKMCDFSCGCAICLFFYIKNTVYIRDICVEYTFP